MGDVILTAGVRQNLLSLQNTADLMATTQNRFATGKKVNSALDNPTNFFIPARFSLNNRAKRSQRPARPPLAARRGPDLAGCGKIPASTSLTSLVKSAKSMMVTQQAQQRPPRAR